MIARSKLLEPKVSDRQQLETSKVSPMVAKSRVVWTGICPSNFYAWKNQYSYSIVKHSNALLKQSETRLTPAKYLNDEFDDIIKKMKRISRGVHHVHRHATLKVKHCNILRSVFHATTYMSLAVTTKGALRE